MSRNNTRGQSRNLFTGSMRSHDERGGGKSLINESYNDHNAKNGSFNSKVNGKSKVIADDDYKLLQSYFKEVGTESLMTASQELKIAIKIKEYSSKAKRLEAVINELSGQVPCLMTKDGSSAASLLSA